MRHLCADAFNVDIRLLVRDNPEAFPPRAMGQNYGGTLSSRNSEWRDILQNVKRLRVPSAEEPRLECTVYADANATETTSNFTLTLASSAFPDTPSNTSSVTTCSLTYIGQDVMPSADFTLRGVTLHICNISAAPGQFEQVAYLSKPRESQARALRVLLDAWGHNSVPVSQVNGSRAYYCNVADGRAEAGKSAYYVECDSRGYITYLELDNPKGGAANPRFDDVALVAALLALERLQHLYITVNDGVTPPQLGALRSLKTLHVRHWCLGGTLPAVFGWSGGWRNMTQLTIKAHEDAVARARLDARCGVRGSIPGAWGTQLPYLTRLDLSNNAFTGALPPELGLMRNMTDLLLANNKLSGALPLEYAGIGDQLYTFDVSGNRLQGSVPLAWASINWLQMFLDNNPELTGCVPKDWVSTIITYRGTGITGICSSLQKGASRKQLSAVVKLLPRLFNADRQKGSPVWRVVQTVADALNPDNPDMDAWLATGNPPSKTVTDSDARGILTITVEVQDGAAYVTTIYSYGSGLDLRVLPDLLQACRASGGSSATCAATTATTRRHTGCRQTCRRWRLR